MVLLLMKWNDMMMVTMKTVFKQSVTDSRMWTARLSPPASPTDRPAGVGYLVQLFVRAAGTGSCWPNGASWQALPAENVGSGFQ